MKNKAADSRQKTSLLGAASLFSQLDRSELSIVSRYSGYRSYEPGEAIFTAGSQREELFVIRDGSVVIRKGAEPGDALDIARFVAGEVFGEMDLLDAAPRTASAVAAEACTLLVFPVRMEFRDLLERHPDAFARILRKLLGEMARRIRAIDRLISEKSPWIEELRKQLHRDRLTSLYNRTFLEEELGKLLTLHPKTSLLVVKPDNFKTINDTYGHDAGDKTLMLLAQAVIGNLGAGDLGVRYRGDEYCVLLPGRGSAEASSLAERLRTAVRTIDLKELTGGADLRLSASVGVSVHPGAAQDAKTLVERAFQRMLEARGAGGDRILVETGA